MSSDFTNDAFDPYRVWLGIPKAEQPPNHYRLLGVSLFESDPDVIQEGADRQVAHLKTKQTGARVVHSQRLLQQVVAAVGVLLDEKAKAKYDKKLRAALEPAAPQKQETAPEPLPSAAQQAPAAPLPMAPPPPVEQPSLQPVLPPPSYVPPPQPPVMLPPAPYSQPGSLPGGPGSLPGGPGSLPGVPGSLPGLPVYQQPIFPQPVPTYQAPVYAPQPLRPIPAPIAEPPAAELSEQPLPAMTSGLGSVSVRGSRAKGSGSDLLKLVAAGGVAIVLLLIAWTVLSQPGMLGDGVQKKSPVVAKVPSKTKLALPKTSPFATPAPTKSGTSEPVDPPTTPATTEADPAPQPMPEPAAPTTPAPTTPAPIPATPAVPAPVMPAPQPPAIPPATSPSVPAPVKPAAKTLWRYAGGFIEQEADGTWRELAPSGDYFTLTAAPSAAGDAQEFERTAGLSPAGGRLRVFDNRLEQTTGLGTFSEIAKGSWVAPADQIEMETPQQAMLQRACQLYAESLSKARRKLLQQFDEALSVNRKRIGKADERLAVITVLEAEKSRFETEGLVPWSLPMQADTAKYLAELHQARGPSDALFQKVISHFVTRKDSDTAASVDALKQKVLAPLVIAKLTKIDTPRPAAPFGGFNPNRRRNDELPEDDGNYGDDPRTGAIRLWSNGAINNANGKSNWTTGMGLQLHFARQGYTIVDTIAIGERGDEFSGKSQFSTRLSLNFTGKFENKLDPHEHRPVVKFGPKLKAEAGAAEATE